MSESAVKRAISGSVAGDEEQPPGSAGTGDEPRGDQVGIVRWKSNRERQLSAGGAIFLCYCRRFYGKIRAKIDKEEEPA